MAMRFNEMIGKTLCTKCRKASCNVAYWCNVVKVRNTESNQKSKAQAIEACDNDRIVRLNTASFNLRGY